MPAKKLSRLESNKEIRRALVRSGADMSLVNYSCHGRSVSLSGRLCKDGGREMSSSNIEVLMQDMNRLGLHIICDLENWSISEGSIAKKGPPKEDNKKDPTQNQEKKKEQAPSKKS